MQRLCHKCPFPLYDETVTCSELAVLQACRDIIRDLAGMDDLSIDIKTVKQWVMHAQVAERYFSNHQRIILAGDAAHRFPPAGGFGKAHTWHRCFIFHL